VAVRAVRVATGGACCVCVVVVVLLSFLFWGCRRRVVVTGVGDGETESVSAYKGNLNNLSVLFFRPPPLRRHNYALEKVNSIAVGLVSSSRAFYSQENCV
jgi:Na+/melibiose symporter-like transporter